MDKYPAKAHARRVAAELNIPKGLILLQGAKQNYYPNSDQPIPFRQHRQFYYLTGCNEPGSWMTYDVEKDTLTLWLPKPNEGRALFFDGRACTKMQAKERYDVDEVKIVQGPKKQPKRTNLRKVLFDHYQNGGQYAFFKMPRALIGPKLRKMMKERRKTGLRAAMNKCRVVKDEYEVALIRKAAAISGEAHMDVMKQLHFLKSEPEVEALYLSTCLAHGAKNQAFGPVCGSGKNASQMHYVKNDADFNENSQVLLMNAGAQWEQYASAMTRSMPLNVANAGVWPSKEAEMVYSWVATIQQECIQQLTPGKKFIDVAWQSVHRTIDALLHLAVLKGEHMEIFHAGTVLAFYPHGLGHHVGLDVNDVSPMRLGAALKSRMMGKGKGQGKGKGLGPKKNGGAGTKGKQAGPKNMGGAGKNAGGKPQGAQKPAGKPSWGKKPADPEKAVLFDQEAEKQKLEKKGGQKKNKQAGPKNGKGKGKGKKVGAAKKGPQDARFKRTQGAYRAFAASNEALMPKAMGLKPGHYSLRPRFCHAPNTPTSPALQAGNVITVAPGIYFNRYMLNSFFLKNKKHAKFIDEEVLKKFMPVGGVRIEDTVLITEGGAEVLSEAVPKGDEMVNLIKESAFVSV